MEAILILPFIGFHWVHREKNTKRIIFILTMLISPSLNAAGGSRGTKGSNGMVIVYY